MLILKPIKIPPASLFCPKLRRSLRFNFEVLDLPSTNRIDSPISSTFDCAPTKAPRPKPYLVLYKTMTSNHASLDAAATERKARLAKLASLKRKAPPIEDSEYYSPAAAAVPTSTSPSSSAPKPTTAYLSGRNYDPETRGPKLGFENAPNAEAETLEDRAAVIALETRAKEEKERQEEKPIDLFSLQPKKPNWDLKRDVARKMEALNSRTENAIARLVRERVEGQKRREVEKGDGGATNGQGEGESLGMGGVDLVEGVHVRERQEEEEKEQEKRMDKELYGELIDAQV